MKLIESAAAAAGQAIFGVDVGKDELHLLTKLGGQDIQKTFANRTDPIERTLDKLIAENPLAMRRRLLVVEATGSYHESLLRIARE